MKKLILGISLLLVSISMAYATQQPTHVKYAALFPNSEWSFYNNPIWEYWDTWVPGQFTDDDNFFISRVKLKPRFENKHTQVDPEMTTERKVLWWMPIGESSKSWYALPRFTMNADNFNMWQYIDTHGNWSSEFFRVNGAFSDACHKNGVPNGVLMFMDQAEGGGRVDYENPGTNKHAKILNKLMEKDVTGKFKHTEKLIKMLKYYGIGGLTFNPEASITENTARALQDFIEELHVKAKELGWEDNFFIAWYDGMTNSGSHSFGSNTLSADRYDWFRHKEKNTPIVDQWFLNYNIDGWGTSPMTTSQKNAEALGRDPFEVYAGFHVGGRGLSSANGGAAGKGWEVLAQTKISIGLWGEHATNNIYSSCNEFGNDDLTFSQTYLKKLERFFSGGNANPANCPPVTNTIATTGYAAMADFHGIAKLLPARSTMQEIPFVTRFNLGNGQFYKVNGETTNNTPWYNLGVQDFLPSWRWWVIDDAGKVPADAIHCELSFDDAWIGGSSLKLSGATAKSNVRLFKTKFAVEPTYKLSFTYKLNATAQSKLKLTYCLEGSEATFQSYSIPDATVGEWNTMDITLAQLGLKSGDVIACIGLSAENTPANYVAYIGELSIVNPAKSYQPVKPVFRENSVETYLSDSYNTCHFKVIWDSKAANANDPYEVTYNEDVDTWYFEVLVKEPNKEPFVATTTSSWGAFCVSTVDPKIKSYKFGVRAVAPDGKTCSEITWCSKDMVREYIYDTSIKVDAASKLGPNDPFTISMVDPTIPDPTWTFISPEGEVLYTATGHSFSYQYDKTGIYSVSLSIDMPTEAKPDSVFKKTYAGLIQITPLETGLPPIADFDITTPTVALGTNGETEPITVNFTGRKGEGTASQAISLASGNNYLGVSDGVWGRTRNFTYALWLRPVKNGGQIFSHRAGAYLPSYGAIALSMDGATGNLTISAREADYATKDFNTDYPLFLNSWYHLCLSYEDATKTVKLYVGGKLVYTQVLKSYGVPPDQDIFSVGGDGIWADMDEVAIWNRPVTADEAAAMMFGYKENIPADLKGYYTFESYNEGTNTFPNLGTAGSKFDAAACKNVSMGQKYKPAFTSGSSWLTGALPLKTTMEWLFAGAKSMDDTDNEAPKVIYDAEGVYSVKLSMSNVWGTDVKEVATGITISPILGINSLETEAISAYPIPFKEHLFIRFTEEGTYGVEMFNSLGQLIMNQQESVSNGTAIQLTPHAVAGIYFVVVKQNNKIVKKFKVTKL